MKPSDFKAMMEQANSAADKGGDFQQLPPGLYSVEVNKVWRNESKTSQRNQISFAGKVLEGEHTDASHFWHCGLDHEIGLRILLNELRTMGVDTHAICSFDDFDAVCENLTQRKPVLAIRIVKKGEYYNSKVDQVLGWNGESDSAPAVASPSAGRTARPAPAPVVEAAEEIEAPEAPEADEPPPDREVPDDPEPEQEVELAPGMKVRFVFQKKEVVGVVKQVISDDDIRVTYEKKPISLKSVEIIGLVE